MKTLTFLSLLICLMVTTLIGCGPVKLEQNIDVAPNETAFLVALEKDNQGKFQSIDYLEQNRVAAKRISLPQRQQSTGRFWYDYQYIPTARVIKVDRSLVSRKWTGDSTDKDSGGNEAATSPLQVESLDSIGFAVGVTITARIDESDAARFLYYHAGKQLSEVIDTNIKSFILSRLSSEFGSVALNDCRTKKNEIFKRVGQETTAFFKLRGITIEYMGLSEGLHYLNRSIQQSIDNSFMAEQDRITAQQEQDAQVIRNQTIIAKTTAESKAANELAKNLSAAMAKQNIEIQLIRAKALQTMSEKWNGALPANVIPSDNPLMGMFFGAAKR